MREPLTFHLVLTIRDLQKSLDRVPFRDEILDSIGERMPENKGMDEPELSRQLKKLGWSELIPKRRKSRKSQRPNFKPITQEQIEKIRNFSPKSTSDKDQ